MDAINELGSRGLPLHATPTSVQRLALAGVAPEFASLPDCPTDVTVEDAITRVLGQDPDYVDDTTTGKPALFKRGLVSLPRVQAGLVPLCSAVPPEERSLLEDDATSPLLQRDCAERFEGRLACNARHRGNPRLYGRFLGDLNAKGLIAMGTARARVCPFVVLRKDGLQMSPGTALFKAQGNIERCFYQLRLPHWFGQFFGHLPIARKHLTRWLQSCIDTSADDVVEFHCWWCRCAGIGQSGLFSRCWNISCRMKLAKRR